jgi:hypothetical protein
VRIENVVGKGKQLVCVRCMVARDASIILDWHQGALDSQYSVLIESMFPEMPFLEINLTENLRMQLQNGAEHFGNLINMT